MSLQYPNQQQQQQQQAIPDLRPFLTRTNLLRVAALACLGFFAYSALGVAPKMASKAGAPVNDVINTLIPLIGGIVTWIVANLSKVKPSLIQAAIAAFKNPQDPVADLRLGVEMVSYFKSQWPDSPAMVNLDKWLTEFGPTVVSDVTKMLPGPAVQGSTTTG